MKLNIKILSDNTLLEPGEMVLEELYIAKEEMGYRKSTSCIQSMKDIIEGYPIYPSATKFKRYNCVVLNKKNIFDIVYNTGQSIFEKINAKYTIECYLSGSFSLDYEAQYFFENIYSKWIMDYGFPHQSDNEDDWGEYTFIWDCLTLYIFFYIHKLRSAYEISIENDPYIQTSKIIDKLNKAINLFKKYWLSDDELLLALFSNKEIKENFSDFYHFRYSLEKTSLQLKKITDNKNYLNYIKKGMLYYLNRLIKNDRPKDFKFKSQSVLKSKTDEYKKLDICAPSLMSIAYDQLLNNLTSGSYDSEVKKCKNPECDNYFSAYGNNKFCSEKCAEAGAKIRRQKYDKTHNIAEQAKLRRKHNKMLDELISLKGQYNFPKEIGDKINHYIEKREKKSISFHDVGIEELYKEVKNYLKNKYNTLID